MKRRSFLAACCAILAAPLAPVQALLADPRGTFLEFSMYDIRSGRVVFTLERHAPQDWGEPNWHAFGKAPEMPPGWQLIQAGLTKYPIHDLSGLRARVEWVYAKMV